MRFQGHHHTFLHKVESTRTQSTGLNGGLSIRQADSIVRDWLVEKLAGQLQCYGKVSHDQVCLKVAASSL